MLYYCNNKGCKEYKVLIATNTFKTESGNLVSRCSYCKEIKVADERSRPKKFGVPMISRIGSMTEQEKKSALLKRSDDDFRKNGEKYDQFVRQQEEAGNRYR